MDCIVNRNTLKLIDFEIGDGKKATYVSMALRLKEKYRINHLCTDGNKVYGYYKISDKHYITKKETCLVESWNCRLRHYLARLKRKTLCYNKSEEMLRLSIMMLINKEDVLAIV